jgi:hypothetical protein
MKPFLVILLFLFSFNIHSTESFKESLALQAKTTHSHPITNYKQARQILFGDLYLGPDNTLKDVYCDMTFSAKHGVGKGKIPDPNIVNCEHTWPQSKFSNQYPKDVQKNDLHHLFPSYSKANTSRSNNPLGTVISHQESIPNCSASMRGNISESNTIGFEPPDYHKGNVARALFYFSIRYDLSIPEEQEKTYRIWSDLDPVDEEEAIVNLKIKSIQGNSNIFIEHPENIKLVEDF